MNKYTVIRTLTGNLYLELEEKSSGINLIYQKEQGNKSFLIADLDDGSVHKLPELFDLSSEELFQKSLVLDTYGFDLELIAKLQLKLKNYTTHTREGFIKL